MERFIEYERGIEFVRKLLPLHPHYMEESRGQEIDISAINVTHGRDILVHNSLKMHTFTVHGVEIQAPNLKAAKKIYNRTKHKITWQEQ